MNTNMLGPDLSLVVANARLHERLAETAVERWRASTGAGVRGRLARLIGTVRETIGEPVAGYETVVPRLTDYPYRG